MNKIRYAARKVDANQAEIVAALRSLGASVISLHDAGSGIPDLLVGFRGVTRLVEVKNPDTKGKLNERQIHWHSLWRGDPVVVVYSVDDVLAAFPTLPGTVDDLYQ